MTVPEASAAWEVEKVAGELRETYLAVAAATVLLERTSAGCAHPAIRQARRCGDDALDLAGEAERQLTDGVRRLHTDTGQPSIGDLVEVLGTARDQLGAAAERVTHLPGADQRRWPTAHRRRPDRTGHRGGERAVDPGRRAA
ncbi:hypothetical protein ACLQ26_12735 [Micromonospora sp. DT43]|uniref:hypothetical protein n=1 Tax=Micromonospora sp. DT43 TaxID=3393440 RepID=UPI003CEB7286